MNLALHLAALLAGLYIFSLTVFMKESAEGRWVNRIEEFWIRVDERRRFAGETTKALFNLVAEKVTRTINRFVGAKVISARLIGLSGCLSFTCLFFGFGLFAEAMSYFVLRYHDIFAQHTHDMATIDRGLPLLIVLGFIFFGFGAVCIVLSVLAINLRSSVWAWLSCAPTAIVTFLFLRLLYLRQLNGGRASLFVALVVSLASDIVLLIVIRQSLHWMEATTSALRLSIALIVQLFLAMTVFLLPVHLLLVESRSDPKSALAVGVLAVSIMNIPTALACVSFMFTLAIVLIHRATWPFLSKAVYILTRNEVLDKRNTIRIVASALIVYGLSGIPSMLFALRLFKLLNK